MAPVLLKGKKKNNNKKTVVDKSYCGRTMQTDRPTRLQPGAVCQRQSVAPYRTHNPATEIIETFFFLLCIIAVCILKCRRCVSCILLLSFFDAGKPKRFHKSDWKLAGASVASQTLDSASPRSLHYFYIYISERSGEDNGNARAGDNCSSRCPLLCFTAAVKKTPL